jgi:hypothetical protein
MAFSLAPALVTVLAGQLTHPPSEIDEKQLSRSFDYLFQPCKYRVSLSSFPVNTDDSSRVMSLLKSLDTDSQELSPMLALEQLIQRVIDTHGPDPGLRKASILYGQRASIESTLDSVRTVVDSRDTTFIIDRNNEQLSILEPGTFFVASLDRLLEPLPRTLSQFSAPRSRCLQGDSLRVSFTLGPEHTVTVWLRKDSLLPLAALNSGKDYFYSQITYRPDSFRRTLLPSRIVRVFARGQSDVLIRCFEISDMELLTTDTDCRTTIGRDYVVVDLRFAPAFVRRASQFNFEVPLKALIDVQ